MTNLSGISLICVTGDSAGGAPAAVGAPAIATHSANAVGLPSLIPNLVASTIHLAITYASDRTAIFQRLDFFDGALPPSYVIFPFLLAPYVVLSMHLLFGFSLNERA